MLSHTVAICTFNYGADNAVQEYTLRHFNLTWTLILSSICVPVREDV
jgi:hypothetical protein